jgi:ribosome-binding factor A
MENDRRVRRVEREMREVIASYLLTGFRGELKGLVSVSRVGVGRDLRSAHIFVSVMGEPGDADFSLKTLQENAYQVQNEIGRKLQMKFCPKLKFVLDESMANVLKVEQILREISQKKDPSESE